MLQRSDLHDYQHNGIDHLLDHDRAALWAPVGSGKGAMTLTALDDLSLVERDVWPALALGTLRVARSVWPFESQEWDHLQHIKCIDATGDVDTRRRAVRQKAHIHSINYDQLGWLVESWGDDWPYRTVIADESTKLKSFRLRQGGKRAGALGKIAHDKVHRFINLTGTPSPNGLKDLWGQTFFLDRGERLGRTFSAFEQRWFRKGFDGFSMEPLPHAQHEIEEKLKDICLTVEGLPIDEPIYNKVYVDLPVAVRKLYSDMEREMFLQLEGVGVEAFNAAARTSKCLAEGTEILTDSGWKPIERYTDGDRLWDGIEWVSASNLVCNGLKNTVDCWGVEMTPDHRVLTHDGWREAQEILRAEPSKRHSWKDVRLPEDHSARRFSENFERIGCGHVDSRVRLWKSNSSKRRISPTTKPWTSKILWLPTWRDASSGVGHSWNDRASSLAQLERYEVSLRESYRQGLEELRSAWNQGLRSLANILQGVLGGYGSNVHRRPNARSKGQQRPLRARQLSMGHRDDSNQQYASQRHHRYPEGAHDDRRGGSHVRPDLSDPVATSETRMLPKTHVRESPTKVKVYDITNVGPRHRFTVRGRNGEIFLAHNCLQLSAGSIITNTDTGEWKHVHDAKMEALEDIVEESNGAPIIVAYQFKADLARLQKRFKDAVVLDSNPKTIERWNAGDIPILLGHPASMGHGINLARGGNILVFFSLGWNLEEHEQVIGRIGPMRQKQAGLNRPVMVHYLLAKKTLDDAVLERLHEKKSVQQVLLDALRRRR